MKRVLFYLILIFTMSCSDSSKGSEKEPSESNLGLWFPNFPANPFLNLEFHEDRSSAVEKIKTERFTEKSSTEHFLSEDKNVEIIFAESDKLSNFKIVFFDQKEAFYNEIEALFEEKASIMNKNEQFSVYTFDTKVALFNVTVFNFENMMRLHFKPTTLH